MRIQFISQLFDPENSIKGLEFTRQLQLTGNEVEVVTTFPSYPGGKIYTGFRQRLMQVEIVDGVRIVRLPTYINHGHSVIKRLLSYISFGLAACVYTFFISKKPDVIYAYYPPVVVGLTALLVGKFRRVPYVYDVQDLWPDVLVATGHLNPKGTIIRWIDTVCNLIYRHASRIVVLSEGYRESVNSKGVPFNKIELVLNWCDESRMKITTGIHKELFDHQFFNILYAGNLGTAQALNHVICAANLIKKTTNSHVRFVFLGTGLAELALKQQAKDLNLDNVMFLSPVDVGDVGSYLTAADALLVHLADNPVFSITIPQKTQAYLLAGRPILMAVRGDAAKIIHESKAGLIVEPCDPTALAQAAITMSRMSPDELLNMATNGQNFYQKKMSMINGVKIVERLLNSVVEASNA